MNDERSRDLYDAYMDGDPYSSNLREEDNEEEFYEILREHQEYNRKRASRYNSEETYNTKENKSHHKEEKNFNSEFFNNYENMFKSQRKTDKILDIQVIVCLKLART